MNRRMTLLAFLLVGVIVYCVWSGYRAFQHPQQEQPQTFEVTTKETVLSDNAQLVYQYYYMLDGVTKEQREPIQDFMKGLSLQQIQSIYHDWQILSFSADEVVLRCSIQGHSDACFVLGQKDGFLAVFQENAQKQLTLYEVTDIPLAALPLSEQQQLQEGIAILGEENLSKVLSDYGS